MKLRIIRFQILSFRQTITVLRLISIRYRIKIFLILSEQQRQIRRDRGGAVRRDPRGPHRQAAGAQGGGGERRRRPARRRRPGAEELGERRRDRELHERAFRRQ